MTQLENEIIDGAKKYLSFSFSHTFTQDEGISEVSVLKEKIKTLLETLDDKFEVTHNLTLLESGDIDVTYYIENENKEYVKGDYICFDSPAPNKDIYKIVLKPKVKHGITMLTIEIDGNRREIFAGSVRRALKDEIIANTRLD